MIEVNPDAILITIVYGTISSVIAHYLILIVDKLFDKCKNDRHSPKHGH